MSHGLKPWWNQPWKQVTGVLVIDDLLLITQLLQGTRMFGFEITAVSDNKKKLEC